MIIKDSKDKYKIYSTIKNLLSACFKKGVTGLFASIIIVALLLEVSLRVIYYHGEGGHSLALFKFVQQLSEEGTRPAAEKEEGAAELKIQTEKKASEINIKHIHIKIDEKNFQKLEEKRKVALAKKVLISSPEDYVPAKIEYEGKSVNVMIRLKGDLTDQLEGDKWSFRIKVRGNNTLFGMRLFSIHHPRTRNFIYEWIYHQALRREGIISLRYDFIDVTINGRKLGIFALEEHFEKNLLAHNQRIEGPIIKFNEDLQWEDAARRIAIGADDAESGLRTIHASHIDAFGMKRILKDPSLYEQFIKGRSLLYSFLSRRLPVSQVFDSEKLAKDLAISDLLGAQHGNTWINYRFYYNPATSLLEPIGFDGNAGGKIKIIVGLRPFNIFLFKNLDRSDPDFFKKYVEALEIISRDSYLDNLLNDLKKELDEKLNIIKTEFADFVFSEDVFLENRELIKTTLNPLKGFHAFYLKSDRDNVFIELGNIQRMPMEVLNISYKESSFQPDKTIILPGRKKLNSPVSYSTYRFTFPKGLDWTDSMIKKLKVSYRLPGTKLTMQESIFPWPRLPEDFLKDDLIRQPANAHEFGFLSIDESTKRILIKPGQWKLDRDLIIPGEYRVVGAEGTKINLSRSARILSFSPLELIGSEDNPITIYSADLTGQGLVVMNTGKISTLKYVVFKNLASPSQGGWNLTGAVTFYGAPVNISFCQFEGTRSEDALNIIRSDFLINRTLFDRTFSDAFDADYAKGTISDSSFVASGNDAIDISGSFVKVNNLFINKAGDKGVSVGENSRMKFNRIHIKNSKIGLASKDMSKVEGADLNLADCRIGLAAYQKKREFGPSSISVSKVTTEKISLPYLIENRSTITVDGKEIISRQKKKEDVILEKVKYGRELRLIPEK
jgi:hypothetical protein